MLDSLQAKKASFAPEIQAVVDGLDKALNSVPAGFIDDMTEEVEIDFQQEADGKLSEYVQVWEKMYTKEEVDAMDDAKWIKFPCPHHKGAWMIKPRNPMTLQQMRDIPQVTTEPGPDTRAPYRIFRGAFL